MKWTAAPLGERAEYVPIPSNFDRAHLARCGSKNVIHWSARVSVTLEWLEGGEPERIDQTPTELGALTEPITALSAHPRSDLLLIGTGSGNLLLFDVSKGDVVRTIRAHTKDVTQIVFTPDGERFLTASVDGFVQWWSSRDYQRQQGYSAGSPIFAVAPSPGGRYVAAGGHDRTVRIWDTGTSELAHSLAGHADEVTALDWLSEGILVSGGSDGLVRAWEVDVRRCFRSFRAHDEQISRLIVSQSRDSYLTASWDGRIKVWTSKHRLKFELPAGPAAVTSVSSLPGDKMLAVGYWNGTAVVWDLEKASVFEEFAAHEGNLAGVASSLGGQIIITASHDGHLRSWSLSSMGVSRFANLHTGEVYDVTYSPDNTEALSVGHDGQVKIWDRGERLELACLDPQIGPVMSVAISPDKRLWALGLSSGEIRLWNAEQQTFEGSLDGHKDAVSSLMFLPQGHQLLSGSWDMKLKLWPLDRNVTLGTLHGHSKEVACIDVSLDGRLAVSASWDMTARLWDLTALRRGYLSEMRILAGHEGRVLACAFSPDGRHVATASSDQTVRLWSSEKATDPKILHGHRDAVTQCRFTPDGRWLVTVGRDGKLCVWSTEDGNPLAELDHGAPILALAIAPDGAQCLLGDESGRTRFAHLDAQTGPIWIAATTVCKDPPIWLRGSAPTETHEAQCIYCGRVESIKKLQLGRAWKCTSCGETFLLCPRALPPLASAPVD